MKDHLSTMVQKKSRAKSYCFACDKEIDFFSILICPNCIDDKCNRFTQLFKEEDKEEEDDDCNDLNDNQ